MNELPLIFAGGLLGSSHCVGMCGGFSLLVGLRTGSRRQKLFFQSVFTAGRLFSYSTMGAVAGTAGANLMAQHQAWVNVPATLTVFAGTFLIVQGLHSLGINLFPWSPGKLHTAGCLLASGYRSLLMGRGWPNVFLAGLFTGLLPCGLVYGFAALAASSGDMLTGVSIMAAFGMGTAPLMIAAGWGASLLSVPARRRLLRLAALCVVLTGALTVARGVSFVRWSRTSTPARCPFCAACEPGEQVDVQY